MLLTFCVGLTPLRPEASLHMFVVLSITCMGYSIVGSFSGFNIVSSSPTMGVDICLSPIRARHHHSLKNFLGSLFHVKGS